MGEHFSDRAAAGRALAALLQAYAGRDDVVVLALARGGVLVGREVARALGAPIDVAVVDKLELSGHPGVAIGAIAAGGVVHLDAQVIADSGVTPQQLDEAVDAQSVELIRRHALYCSNRAPEPLEDRTVIVVDDAVATGMSMQAALKALRNEKPAWVVVAVPVAPPEAVDRIGTTVDEFVCVHSPPEFTSASPYYGDYHRVSDEQVREALVQARERRS